MKTFREWLISENFRTATLTSIKDERGQNLPIYYELVKSRKFDLPAYMSSFNNNQIRKEIGSSTFSALICSYGIAFAVYVFSTLFTHIRIAKLLDANKEAKRLPNINYAKEYLLVYNLKSGQKVSRNWIFPVFFFSSFISTNLEREALETLNAAVKLQTTFQISDSDWHSNFIRPQE